MKRQRPNQKKKLVWTEVQIKENSDPFKVTIVSKPRTVTGEVKSHSSVSRRILQQAMKDARQVAGQ